MEIPSIIKVELEVFLVKMKPSLRGAIRRWAGIRYYRLRRRLEWMFSPKAYARRKQKELLPYQHASHRTPTLRQLSNVDMWLQYNKVTNLKLAAEKLSGLILGPGETFSYWRSIGKPTKRQGYLEGMVLQRGTVTAGVGGGLCQLSNLIYWMTLHTPLTVTERHRHSYDVFPDSGRTQPFGSGATCYYNYIDLQIENRSPEPFQLVLRVTDTHLEGEWRSSQAPAYRYEIYESRHWITPEVPAGYMRHNEIRRRVFTLDGELARDEQVAENHAWMMYEPLLAST